MHPNLPTPWVGVCEDETGEGAFEAERGPLAPPNKGRRRVEENITCEDDRHLEPK
jgi:hypothetical protein